MHAADDVEPCLQRARATMASSCRRILPPTFATPMTSERAPFARASAGVSFGSPTVIALGAQRHLADAALACPVAQTEGGLGVTGFGDVTEEQQIRLRQLER